MQKKYFVLVALLFFIIPLSCYSQQNLSANKNSAIRSVDAHQKELMELSNKIWGFAETGLNEYKSSAALADYLEAQGFMVKRGVAGLPTAFIATYGTGIPVIGVLGEYDALPGLSQKAITEKEPLKEGAPGHGCGHNLLGVGGLGAALAVKELIEHGKIKGTVRFYGTPAEETVGGKVYMARDGLFNDLDICLDWHPYYEIKANTQGSLSIMDITIEFHGKTAHASLDPWDGRSALDALESFAHGVNLLREHVRPSVRMHYVFQKTGDVPNVVPAESSAWLWIRDSTREGVDNVYERIIKIVRGAALIADVESSIQLNNGVYEILVNRTGASVLQANLELLGPIKYTTEEIEFAKKIQISMEIEPDGLRGAPKPLEKTNEEPPSASSDVGDVSWVVPEISLQVTTAPYNVPWHSWAVVACGGMSIGHKGMLYASKAIAMTMVDLFEKEDLRGEIKKEFIKRKGNQVYKAMIPDGPPPISNAMN